MRYLLDASVFISAIQKTETNHRVAKTVLGIVQSENIGLVAHALFFFEVHSTLQRKSGDSSKWAKALAYAKALPVAKFAGIDQRLFLNQERLLSTLGLKGADSVYVAIAAEHKANLITFDKEILERAAAHSISTTDFLKTAKQKR